MKDIRYSKQFLDCRTIERRRRPRQPLLKLIDGWKC